MNCNLAIIGAVWVIQLASQILYLFHCHLLPHIFSLRLKEIHSSWKYFLLKIIIFWTIAVRDDLISNPSPQCPIVFDYKVNTPLLFHWEDVLSNFSYLLFLFCVCVEVIVCRRKIYIASVNHANWETHVVQSKKLYLLACYKLCHSYDHALLLICYWPCIATILFVSLWTGPLKIGRGPKQIQIYGGNSMGYAKMCKIQVVKKIHQNQQSHS